MDRLLSTEARLCRNYITFVVFPRTERGDHTRKAANFAPSSLGIQCDQHSTRNARCPRTRKPHALSSHRVPHPMSPILDRRGRTASDSPLKARLEARPGRRTFCGCPDGPQTRCCRSFHLTHKAKRAGNGKTALQRPKHRGKGHKYRGRPRAAQKNESEILSFPLRLVTGASGIHRAGAHACST